MNSYRLWLLLLGGVIAWLPTAVFAGNTILTWEADPFYEGIPAFIPNGYSYSYPTFYSGTVQERTVSAVITSNNVAAGNMINLEHFDTSHSKVDMVYGSDSYLRVRTVPNGALTDTYTVTLDFGGDVTDIQFGIYNLDYFPNTDRIYQVTVTATASSSQAVTPTLSVLSGNLLINGQTATSLAENSALGVNIPSGTSVRFITLLLTNAETIDNGNDGVNGNIDYRIGNISFSPSTPTVVTLAQQKATSSHVPFIVIALTGVLALLTAAWLLTRRPPRF